MKCIDCKKEMKFEFCNDTGSNGHDDGKSYAYNVYHCFDCCIICKEDVWHGAGQTWILRNNFITRIDKEELCRKLK